MEVASIHITLECVPARRPDDMLQSFQGSILFATLLSQVGFKDSCLDPKANILCLPLGQIRLSYLPTSILSGFRSQRSKEIENMKERLRDIDTEDRAKVPICINPSPRRRERTGQKSLREKCQEISGTDERLTLSIRSSTSGNTVLKLSCIKTKR